MGNAHYTATEPPKSSPVSDILNDSDSIVHYGVGCDGCGMIPIVGNAFRCLDCPEKIGYDLCGDCYTSSHNVEGRFGQHHERSHRMVLRPRLVSLFYHRNASTSTGDVNTLVVHAEQDPQDSDSSQALVEDQADAQ